MATKTFDIRPRKPSVRKSPEGAKSAAAPRKRKKKTEEQPITITEQVEVAAVEQTVEASRDAFLEYVAQSPRAHEPFTVPARAPSKIGPLARKIIRVAVILALCTAGVYLTGVVLARVTVRMKVSQAIQEDVFPIRLTRMDPKVASSSGLFFEDTKKTFSYTQPYPATGSGEANTRAKGTIVVKNSYSTQSMRFVAGTRFSNDKGLVFRTQQAITIPGYTQKSGAVVPGEVEAEVRADTAGPGGNLAAGTVFHVVAFQGGDKYERVIAVAKDGFTGGAQGMTAIVTADDITNAKEQIVEYAFSTAKDEVIESLPEGTRVLDRALQLKVTKTSVAAAAGDAVQSFNASITGELRIRFFDERAVRQYVEARFEAPAIENDVVESELQISYENVSTSFDTADMNMQVRARRVVRPVLDTLAFRQRIAGSAMDELKTELLKLEGLEKVDISVWPFWLSRVPQNIDKVRVALE